MWAISMQMALNSSASIWILLMSQNKKNKVDLLNSLYIALSALLITTKCIALLTVNINVFVFPLDFFKPTPQFLEFQKTGNVNLNTSYYVLARV